MMLRDYKDANELTKAAYERAAELLLAGVQALSAGLDSPDTLVKVYAIEEEIDTIKAEFATLILKAKIAPALISDRLQIMWKIDGAMDQVERIARNMEVYHDSLSPEALADLKTILSPVEKITQIAATALLSLFSSFEETRGHLNEIERTRDTNREKIYALKRKHFAGTTEWKEYFAFDELSSRIRELQDKIESIAERINIILVKYLV